MLEKIKKEFGYEDLKLIISTFIIGFLVHGMVFYNKFATDDSMYSFYDSLNTVSLGRFFSVVTGFFSSFYDLPVVNGFLTLLYGGISVVLLCKIFKVEDFIVKVLIGAVFISFPVVTANFGYMHLADAYMLGVLLSIASFYVFYCLEGNILIASLLLALSIGVYQIYLVFGILLCLLTLIKEIINGKDVRFLILKMLAYGVISLVMYMILMKLSLYIYNIELKTYQGVNELFTVSFYDLLSNLFHGYKVFFYYFIKVKPYNFSLFSFIGYLILATVGMKEVYNYVVCFKNHKYNSILLLVLLLLIPFASNVILIFSDIKTLFYHILMTHHYVLIVIFPLTFIKIKNIKLNNLVMLSTVLIVFNYFIVANVAYFNMQQKYEKSYALALRVIDRMEQTGCSLSESKVLFTTKLFGNPNTYFSQETSRSVTERLKGAEGNHILVTPFHFQQFAKHYIGIDLDIYTEDEIDGIVKQLNIKDMPQWPHKDSIQCIDNNTIVINFIGKQ
ncbi:hypothetical protein EII25_01740 [Erysipelotrichaceae bacterium OH741_COT-311]|nr:hypothetical protein EII25_01740 [Erysipelotrichaceae bacterium OH741_COT-311]